MELVEDTKRRIGFYCILFVVPKASGEPRPILNLRPLNTSLVLTKFRFETLAQIIEAVQPGDFLASIDLKDAYLHVGIRRSHWIYLRFMFQGVCSQLKVLFFGLKTAPKVWTKILAPVIAYLRRQDILIYAYIDDILIRAPTKEALKFAVELVIKTLLSAGFVINLKKSEMEPTQDLVYIGGHFRTDLGVVLPPQDRILKLQGLLKPILPGIKVTAHYVLRILGVMASMIQVVMEARLHMRHLQLFLLSRWRPVRDSLWKMVTIPDSVIEDVNWWLESSNLLEGVPVNPPQPQHTVTTDASETGWGDSWMRTRVSKVFGCPTNDSST